MLFKVNAKEPSFLTLDIETVVQVVRTLLKKTQMCWPIKFIFRHSAVSFFVSFKNIKIQFNSQTKYVDK